jgi:DNA repair exonuclease SbcCD ATPase subunit
METPNKKSSSTLYLLIGVVVLQFGIIAYLLYSNSDKSNQIQDLTTTVDTKSQEITSKIQEFDSLAVEFERIKQEREALGLSNDTLNQQIEELQAFKAKAMASGQINARDKRKLEEMVAKLREDLVAKDKEISDLKASNKDLEGKLNEVSAQSTHLGDSLAGVATVKKDLENQLAYASILKAENVKISALKENGKEYVEEIYKGSKISQMKITFAIADNKAAKQGYKDFLVSVVTPSGEAFSDTINGGGTFTTAEGETKTYTFKQNVNFTNSNETVVFLIPKGFNYTPGNYKVLIYNAGYEIGQSKFAVK